MNEHPIFVPFGEDYLAAVVTVPEETARSAVLLLQGSAGTPRSHRHRLWTRTCRALAARGFVAIRMDYRGVGDSSGPYGFAMDRPPLDEARAVAELVLGSLGLDRLGVVGNCVGARVALGLATRLDQCASVASVLPMALGPVLRGQGRTPATRAALAFAKRYSAVRRVGRWFGAGRAGRRLGPGVRFIPEVPAALRSADLMFLHGGTERSRAKLARGVAALRSEAGDGRGHRAEAWRLDFEGRAGFRPIEVQQAVIDSVVRWMEQTLAAAQPAPTSIGEGRPARLLGSD